MSSSERIVALRLPMLAIAALVLTSLIARPSEGQLADQDRGTVTLTYPGKPWSLLIDLPGFELDPVQVKSDGTGVMVGGDHPASGLMVSVFLEPSREGWTAVRHRDHASQQMKDSPLKRQKIKRWERGEMALLEYHVPVYQGLAIKQQHVNAYLVRDGIWVDVHLSMVEFTPKDAPFFDEVVNSIRFGG